MERQAALPGFMRASTWIKMLHHHCISPDLLAKAPQGPILPLRAFERPDLFCRWSYHVRPTPSFLLAHYQLLTMTVRASNLIPAQSDAPYNPVRHSPGLSGWQLPCPPPHLCWPMSSTARREVHTNIWVWLPPSHTLPVSAQLDWFLADAPCVPGLGMSKGWLNAPTPSEGCDRFQHGPVATYQVAALWRLDVGGIQGKKFSCLLLSLGLFMGARVGVGGEGEGEGRPVQV